MARSFEEWFEDYLRYNKDGYVSGNFVTPEGYRLGCWVARVRAREVSITEQQIELLTQNNFRWSRILPECRSFNEWFKDYLKYHKNGYLHRDFVTPEGHRLGMWVSRTRMGKSKLTPEQIKVLDENEFIWNVRRPYRHFEDWFQDYLKYHVNGWVYVDFVTPEGYKLGKWAQNVRMKKLKLTTEQIELLNQNQFIW